MTISGRDLKTAFEEEQRTANASEEEERRALAEVEACQREYQAAQAGMATNAEGREETLADSLRSAKERFAEAQAEETQRRMRIKHLQQQIKSLSKEMNKGEKEYKAAESEAQAAEEELSGLEAQLAGLNFSTDEAAEQKRRREVRVCGIVTT